MDKVKLILTAGSFMAFGNLAAASLPPMMTSIDWHHFLAATIGQNVQSTMSPGTTTLWNHAAVSCRSNDRNGFC